MSPTERKENEPSITDADLPAEKEEKGGGWEEKDEQGKSTEKKGVLNREKKPLTN